MNVLESKGFVHHYYDKWEQDLVVGQVKGKCQDKMIHLEKEYHFHVNDIQNDQDQLLE